MFCFDVVICGQFLVTPCGPESYVLPSLFTGAGVKACIYHCSLPQWQSSNWRISVNLTNIKRQQHNKIQCVYFLWCTVCFINYEADYAICLQWTTHGYLPTNSRLWCECLLHTGGNYDCSFSHKGHRIFSPQFHIFETVFYHTSQSNTFSFIVFGSFVIW